MNEKHIQNALHNFCEDRGHTFIAPNVNMRWGESDLLSVTRSSFIFDHEIKISRADFKADFKNKQGKHHDLFHCKSVKQKHYLLPNYFVYVVPEDLIKADEVPSYAGLYYWREQKYRKFGWFEVVKSAPRLHSVKTTAEVMQKLARSMMFRYWNYRLKYEG